jgi:hypothetical protein
MLCHGPAVSCTTAGRSSNRDECSGMSRKNIAMCIRLPLRPKTSIRRLSGGSQHPTLLAAVAARRINSETTLAYESKRSCCGGLVDPDRIGKFGGRQIRDLFEHLQGRVLGSVQSTFAEDFLVQGGHRPSGLAQRRTIAGE